MDLRDRDLFVILFNSLPLVSSIAQVVGVILCLNASAKISHRAQGIATLAIVVHAFSHRCVSDDRSHMRFSHSNGNLEAASSLMRWRQSFQGNFVGRYLVSAIDTEILSLLLCINTIFFIELSLVLFVLGRTTVFTTIEAIRYAFAPSIVVAQPNTVPMLMANWHPTG
ncbi:hypothetical protein Tco_1461892, partial [Tanacetum coccineum]